MRTIKCGMARRKRTRPKNAAMAAQAVTIQKAGKSVSSWAVRHSRAVVIRGEMGFHVASQPARPSVRAG